MGSQAHEQYQFYSTRYTSTICKGFSLINICAKHVDGILFCCIYYMERFFECYFFVFYIYAMRKNGVAFFFFDTRTMWIVILLFFYVQCGMTFLFSSYTIWNSISADLLSTVLCGMEFLSYLKRYFLLLFLYTM